MSPLTQGDRVLAGRAGRGDDAAFAALAARHRDRLVRTARRRLGDRRDDAEDVVQDALLNALRALRGGKRPDNPGAWMTAIVANGCADHHRAAARRASAPLLDEAEAGPAGADADPHVVALQRERVAGAVRAVQALPETQREALIGFELSGQTYEELAAEHGWTVPATKSLLWRARTTLATERDRWAAAFATPLVALAQLARAAGERPAALLGAGQGADAATYAVVAVLAVGGAGVALELPAPEAGGAAARAAAPAPAAADRPRAARLTTPEAVLRACAHGRPLRGATPAALRAARDDAPADLEQYTDCAADIRGALARG